MTIKYFDQETICNCCEVNIKKKNQIVCDACHKKQTRDHVFL